MFSAVRGYVAAFNINKTRMKIIREALTKHGATMCPEDGPDVTHVIAHDSFPVAKISAAQGTNVVDVEWVTNCIKAGSLLPLTEFDLRKRVEASDREAKMMAEAEAVACARFGSVLDTSEHSESKDDGWEVAGPRRKRGPKTAKVLTNSVVVILIGSPGAGKSTFSNALCSDNQCFVRVNQDTLGTREACLSAAREVLDAGKSPVIDRCNFDEDQRAPWIKLGRGAGATVFGVLFDISSAELQDRVRKRRNHEGGVQGPKGLGVLARMESQLRRPALREGFDCIEVCKTSVQVAQTMGNLLDGRFPPPGPWPTNPTPAAPAVAVAPSPAMASSPPPPTNPWTLAAASPGPANSWSCAACTFINTGPGMRGCEMCGTPRS
mmetsp:Transcript_64124/g.151733  ORF Transcript_64124/g.151733 Transcript_64124/m.151733 type:complete len:379 (-) Transcript_64124:2433-3569(-)